MDNEEIQSVKFSEFPSATPGNSDEVVGLHSGDNARFSIANIVAAVRNGLANIFVPKTDVGAASGVASLDSTGKVPSSQLPPISSDAEDITYDPTTSGLTATDVQAAIDEVVDDVDGKQSTITASGILKGDGAGGVSAASPGTDYQAPLTIDATPTANSTNPVQSGGVYTDVRTRVPNYGKGKNLLRNWYFVGGGTGRGVFPVNQRGLNSYSGNVYVIDAYHGDSGASLALTQNGTQLSYSSGSLTSMYQYIENPTFLMGKKITLSILDSNGFHTASGTVPSSSPGSLTNIININDTDIFRVRISSNGIISFVWISNTPSSSATKRTVYAAKLELGTEQTLAHQENGTWVLNEIPDYEYELYRCMTSTADPSDTYANKSLATEQQLATVETGTTASRAYAVGGYFCWNGLLYRVKQAISSGVLFTPGTNCEALTATDIVRGVDISSEITPSTGVTINRAVAIGKLVAINLTTPKITSANSDIQVGTITQGYRPLSGTNWSGNLRYATVSDFGYGHISVQGNGNIYVTYSKTTSYGLYASIVYYVH